MRIQLLSTLILTALLSLATSAASAQDCDRECLETFVSVYLDAVADNNPNAVALTDDVRFTENGQQLVIGDGLWNTLVGRGDYGVFVADEAAGQIAFLGTIEEEHRDPDQITPSLLALRLRIVDDEVSEIEHFVVRSPEAAERVNGMSPRAEFLTAVPEDERMSRADLITTANLYFSGMQRNNGEGYYPFSENCERIENGMRTTNVPVAEGQTRADPNESTTYSSQWSCLEQFESGLLYFVNRIRDRRFVAVDEERGLVFAYVFFDHSGGEFRHATAPDGRPVTGGPTQPWTWFIAELFKVDNGELDQIEAILAQVPYGMNSGWSSWTEGMSTVIQDVTFSD